MSLIGKILPADNVILDLDVSSKKKLFEEVSSFLAKRYGVAERDVFECLFAREKLGSTGLSQGAAIPHGRTKDIKETLGVFVRSKEPLPFDAPDDKPVNLFFFLLVPEKATTQHLEVLSEIANVFSSKESREKLIAATAAEEALGVLASG